jgi:hypothetical protein
MKLGLSVLCASLSFSFCLWGQEPPHELKGFYNELNAKFESLEKRLERSQNDTSLAERFLDSVFNVFGKDTVEKNKPFIELDVSPDLKAKLISLSANKEITFDNLTTILKSKTHNLSDAEKIKIAGLVLVHIQKKLTQETDTHKAIESLIKEYQKDPLLEDTKHLKTQGLDLLTEIIARGLGNPESLDTVFMPIKEQIFLAEKNKLPEIEKALVPNLTDAIAAISNLQQNKQSGAGLGIDSLGLNPFSGGIAGSCNSKGRFGVNPNGNLSFASSTPTPPVRETQELKACTNEMRNRRFNVELQLPGSLCASTPIARDPEQTKKIYQQNIEGTCQVKLASANHCVEGKGNLKGRTIGTHIGGINVSSRITNIGSSDQITGQSVQNGNPDLLVMIVEMPCKAALGLNVARVPSPEEIAEMSRRDSMPLVLQQNSTINASIQGNNQATIAATGSFERSMEGELGNFIRFNTKSRLNDSSGFDVGQISRAPGLVLDSNRIKSGDSGGAALTCKFDDNNKVKEVLFMGAISHITVRGDSDEGKEGGIASGKSLLNLSRAIWGDERMAVASRFSSPNSTARTKSAISVLSH